MFDKYGWEDANNGNEISFLTPEEGDCCQKSIVGVALKGSPSVSQTK